ncbi:MAG: putative 4-hydroxybenzoate polyprenyltransferase [Deltaproteobacteria bacterium]|nr:putative 4-hydroxybenzoate polyprenyltransferase [Deltaproteobacteria bacterium]
MFKKIKNTLELVKFSHTIFVLPFALSAFLLAFYDKYPSSFGTPFFYYKIIWIVIAMASGRSGAMAFNRVIDKKIDAKNKRTVERTIPKGELTTLYGVIFGIISYIVLIAAAYELNFICFILSPLVIIFITFYSFTKRFTFFSHMVLGISMALGPLGTWLAVTGGLNYKILILGLAVVFWGSGFDILYAILDYEFDTANGLFSVPAKFGIKNAITVSRILHLLALACLVYLYFIFNLNFLYIIGMILVAGFFAYEHLLVYKSLNNIDAAFFTMNGYISITFFVFISASIIYSKFFILK